MTRAHRKTRTGCAQCKRRRVKCDEAKPCCTNCSRSKVICSLEFLTPLIPQSKERFSPPQSDFALRPCSLDTISMELLHHYLQTGCLGLRTARNMHLWDVTIPQMSLAHEFLLQGLLAVSALHLSTLQPHRKKELTRRAAISEHLALPKFRDHVSQTKPQNIHAVFAFAGFVVPCILARFGAGDAPLGRLPGVEDEHPHWFHALIGVMDLLRQNWAELEKGPFGSVMDSRIDVDHKWSPHDAQFGEVDQILQPTALSSPKEKIDLATCQLTMNALRDYAAVPYCPGGSMNKMTAVFLWPGWLPKPFLPLLYQQKPEALIILAHYCMLLKNVDSCWYMKGVGTSMLEQISSVLSEEWRPRIQWALEQPVS